MDPNNSDDPPCDFDTQFMADFCSYMLNELEKGHILDPDEVRMMRADQPVYYGDPDMYPPDYDPNDPVELDGLDTQWKQCTQLHTTATTVCHHAASLLDTNRQHSSLNPIQAAHALTHLEGFHKCRTAFIKWQTATEKYNAGGGGDEYV